MSPRRVRERGHHFLTRALILVCVALTKMDNPFPGASGGSITYPHVQLSSLGRRQEFAAAASNGGGSSGTMGSVVGSGSGAGGSTSAAGGATATGGGEILAPKSFPLSAQEPTCEELRAMWIFSKRQSRAAEMTNEIPTYRDPFEYNIWDPYYPTTRSIGGQRMVPQYIERARSPVFGRIISREPLLAPRLPLRSRPMGELQSAPSSSVLPSGIYGSEAKSSQVGSAHRRQMQYRFGGGSSSGPGRSASSGGGANANSVAVQGSFQKLKELIWTERAKELTQQRRAEELAARAAVLKEIANGQSIEPVYKYQMDTESPLMDENRSPDQDHFLTNPDQRMSISTGQLVKASQNARHSIGSGAVVRGDKGYKGAIFSGNPASTSGRAARLLLPSLATGNFAHVDGTHERNAGAGVSKAFPMRPSHFRERNRSLLKEPSLHSDRFQRFQRRLGWESPVEPDEGAVLDQLVRAYASKLLKERRPSLEAAAILDSLHPYQGDNNDDDDELNDKAVHLLQDSQQREAEQEMALNLDNGFPYNAEPCDSYGAPKSNCDLLLQHVLQERK